jgi:Na+-translocating ferredoxin:NAD+ oxidoreductase subunit C
MMGVAQYDFSAPVMKATSGIVVLSEAEINRNEETACLKCGQCVDVCPLNLNADKTCKVCTISPI